MLVIRLGFVLYLACASAACGPYIGTCAWLDLTENEAVRVAGPRVVTEPGECDCLRCAAAGQFEIRRAGYTLEFWNGDRWYPALLARVRGNDGRTLTLRSDQLHPLVSTSAQGKWREFDYYADVVNGAGVRDQYRFPASVVVTVADQQGRVLGTEHVVPRLEIRRHLAFDSL